MEVVHVGSWTENPENDMGIFAWIYISTDV